MLPDDELAYLRGGSDDDEGYYSGDDDNDDDAEAGDYTGNTNWEGQDRFVGRAGQE